MIEYSLERDGADPLAFTGELIGAATSRRATSPRWLELWIYWQLVFLDGEEHKRGFVLAGLGGTVLDGETTRHWAKRCLTAEEVLRQLVRVDIHGTEYLTITAEDVLSRAAAHDEDFVIALTEWERAASRPPPVAHPRAL